MKLRHTDPVQIDRFCNWVHQKLDSLKAENTQLRDMLQQLRNKPDVVYDPPNKKNFMIKVGRTRIDLDSPIASWNTNHFIRLFQQQFKQKYNEDYKIIGRDWQANAFRVKQFKDTHEDIQDNLKYREFIEWIFNCVANTKFVPNITTITSDVFLTKWKIATNSNVSTRNSDFTDIIDNFPKTTRSSEEILKDAF